MKDLISKKGIIVAAVAIVIALIAAVTMAVSGGNADFGRVISEPVFKPLRSAMNGLVGTLEDIYGYIYRYDSVVAENAQLKERIAELERDSRDYTEIVEENDRLRSALDLERDVPCRHMYHDLHIESRVWGQVPEIALTLTRRKFNGMPGYDNKYRLNLMIQDRPTSPIAMNLALDTVLRLFRFAITGDGGPTDQLLKKD